MHHTPVLTGRAQLPMIPSSRPYIIRSSAVGGSQHERRERIILHSSQAAAFDRAITRYDPVEIAKYWKSKPFAVVGRLLEIATAVATYLIAVKREELAASAEGRPEDPRVGGACLREELTDLGPAFVKIGQWLSSRPDILSPEYLEELERLQDRIPPFSTVEAMQLIEEELGVGVGDLFEDLTAEPVAAASLGQVYRGRLRGTSDEVAVKVQRPAVRETVSRDVFILRILAGIFRQWRQLNSDLPALLDEWAGSLFKELDYRLEAANARRFRDMFATNRSVYVPHVYTELCSARILVMEWIEGGRLRSAAEANSSADPGDLRLVEVGVRCSLEQVIDRGYYHADPHPGNLLKTLDGRLCYLDFGMMGTIENPLRQGLIRATIHMVNREFDELASDFVQLGLLPPGSDKTVIVPALTGVFEQALTDGVRNLSFAKLSNDLGKTMYQYKFRIPPFYTLLVRSLSVLEGIALSVDKDYKVITAAYPWIARRLLTDNSQEMKETLTSLLYKDGSFQFRRLENLLEQAVKIPGRVGFSAYRDEEAASGDALTLLLGREGETVRGILVDEVAKGVDGVARIAIDEAVGGAQGQARIFLANLEAQLQGAPRTRGILRGALPPNPAMEVLQLLVAAPRLAEKEDREQVQGLIRLAGLMRSTVAAAAATPSGRPGSPASLGPGSLRLGRDRGSAEWERAALEAAEALQWLSVEIQGLPPAARQAALRLPFQLLERVSSRIVARAIRSALVPGGTVAGTYSTNWPGMRQPGSDSAAESSEDPDIDELTALTSDAASGGSSGSLNGSSGGSNGNGNGNGRTLSPPGSPTRMAAPLPKPKAVPVEAELLLD